MDLTQNNLDLKGKLKLIALLAIPAVVENFFQTIIGFVDTLFISKIGIIQVTAVGITNAILQVYFAIFMAIGVAVNVYIAKYIGSRDKEKANIIAQQSILLSMMVGFVMGLLTILFAREMLSMLGASTEVIDSGEIYFKIIAIPSILISLMYTLSSILRGTGDTKSPMKVSIWINLIHIVLDYVLIFGFYFIPSMGLIGAAIATVIVRFLGVVMLYLFIRKSNQFQSLIAWKPIFPVQRQLISLGSPAAGERLVMRIGQVLYFGFVVQLGTETFAAHTIAGNIEIFSYMIGYGLATAATTIIGQQLGAGQKEEAFEYGKILIIISMIVMSLVGIILYFGGSFIATFFSTEESVISQITIALKVDAFIQPILGAVIVLTGVLHGGGNTKYPLLITTIGIWTIRTVFVYVLGISYGWGIAGVWIAIGLDNLFRAITLWYKYKRQTWIKIELFKQPQSYT